jgi:3',5'-cyclic AMP phosphodiesterase CpdA
MQFVSDPEIAIKIAKMKDRVRWQDPLIQARQIDQTRLVLDDGQPDQPEFSFLVIGDSGSGPHRDHHPQRQITEQMLPHLNTCRFVLHTGDVVYLVGSKEYYYKNFIRPYRELLVGGESPRVIAYDRMVFNRPFLPVLGNHDYYDLPLLIGLLAGTTSPIRQLLNSRLDLDIGWRGSHQGRVYAKAFLDYLKAFKTDAALGHHLDAHYTASTETGHCLRYQPGQFTRLPNRYYRFRSGGIDFFALDSNTLNAPFPVTGNRRAQLEALRRDLEQQKQQIMAATTKLSPELLADAEQLDDLRTKLTQLDEVSVDIDKQLKADPAPMVDEEQLAWLQQGLIESWNCASVRGRVIYLHHPPYVTESTKWHQAQTLAIRIRLRKVFAEVAQVVGAQMQGRALVDLVLTGHAHCLEYLQTLDTGHADANINWVICGGSGFSLRRQRQEGPELLEQCPDGTTQLVARSHLYVGRAGQGMQKRRPYSFIRVDVQPGKPPKFKITPFICDRFQQKWQHYSLEPFTV